MEWIFGVCNLRGNFEVVKVTGVVQKKQKGDCKKGTDLNGTYLTAN
jgi:hypothetical protein